MRIEQAPESTEGEPCTYFTEEGTIYVMPGHEWLFTRSGWGLDSWGEDQLVIWKHDGYSHPDRPRILDANGLTDMAGNCEPWAKVDWQKS
jgi:hypothetical protein